MRELLSVLDPLTQLVGPGIGVFHFWRSIALRGDQRRAEGSIQLEGSLRMFRGSW